MTTRCRTMDQVRAFVEGTEEVEFSVPRHPERRALIAQILAELG